MIFIKEISRVLFTEIHSTLQSINEMKYITELVMSEDHKPKTILMIR